MKKLLGILFIFILIPLANADGDADLTYGSQLNGLGFNTARQPNLEYPTLVTAATEIESALSTTPEDGQINYQISPDNMTWTTIAEHEFSADITGLGIAFSYDDAQSTSFIVPKGYYYRFQTIPLSGAPTFTLNQLREVEMDVFDVDPLNLQCPEEIQVGETAFCMAHSQILSGQYTNSFGLNYTVYDSSFSAVDSGVATNQNTLGIQTFNTTPSSVGEYHIVIFNTTEQFSDVTELSVVNTTETILTNTTTEIGSVNTTLLDINTTLNTRFDTVDTNLEEVNQTTQSIWDWLRNTLKPQIDRFELFTNTTFFENNTAEHRLTRENLTQEINNIEINTTGLNVTVDTQNIVDSTTQNLCALMRPLCQDNIIRRLSG